MAFLLFERAVVGAKSVLRPTGQHFQLAGYQLIHQAWSESGKPKNRGWQVSADRLIQLHTGGKESYATRRLVIDFDPLASWRIGLIELLDVYAYTHAEGDEVTLTPLMLRMRDVLYEERPVTPEEKAKTLAEIPEPAQEVDFVEFLYLNGDARRWAWGRNGSTNGAFIQQDARDYFRRFF